MIAAVAAIAAVAEPCAIRSPQLITYAAKITGRPASCRVSAMTSPMPVARSTAP